MGVNMERRGGEGERVVGWDDSFLSMEFYHTVDGQRQGNQHLFFLVRLHYKSSLFWFGIISYISHSLTKMISEGNEGNLLVSTFRLTKRLVEHHYWGLGVWLHSCRAQLSCVRTPSINTVPLFTLSYALRAAARMDFRVTGCSFSGCKGNGKINGYLWIQKNFVLPDSLMALLSFPLKFINV